MKPKISIILPVYNGEKTLEKVLNQLSTQTFSDFEVIIINDGSKDQTSEIALKHSKKDSRFKLYNQSNAGVAAARCKGVKKAIGKYIIHHDVDDCMPVKALELLLKKITEENADIVIGDYKLINKNGTSIIKQNFKGNASEFTQALLNGKYHAALWNKLIKKDLYEGLEFESGINYMEDKLILVRMLFKNPKISYLPEVVYHYIMDPDSLSNSLSQKDFFTIKRIIEHFENDFKLHKKNYNLTSSKLSFKLSAVLRNEKLNQKETFPEVHPYILKSAMKPIHKVLLYADLFKLHFIPFFYRKLKNLKPRSL